MTYDQYIASDPAHSVWVSASAGTGKTKVLTDRVLRLLLAGSSPQKILCITYTRAASAEMESRISAQLASWVGMDDEALKTALCALMGKPPTATILTRARRLFAQVLDAPERIRIQTIHSLCQSILGRFPLEAGVPPHFTAIDEVTAREMLANAKAELFASAAQPEHHEAAEAIAAIAAYISEQTLGALIGQIISSRRKFAQWLAISSAKEHLYKELNIAPDTNHETLIQKHLHYLPDELVALKQACNVLSESESPTDRETCAALSRWLEKRDDIDAYLSVYFTKEGTLRKKLHTVTAAKLWPQLEEVLRHEQQRICAYAEESQSWFVAQMSEHVTVLARAMLALYHRHKQRRAYLDYEDLIFYTAELLRKPGVAPWVLYKLDGGIDHLLVDEAQDTSQEQWEIVISLAAEFYAGESARTINRTLFVVGDEKQSIFSFQGADPSIFDKMQRGLSKRALNASKEFKHVQLALSFRSTAPVLTAVDSVFAQAEARDGLVFTEGDIRHDVHRKEAAGRVELWPLMESPDEEEFPPWHIPDLSASNERADRRCAAQIAETIEGWLKEKRELASQGRGITPGDIMILVQRRGSFTDALLQLLKRKNIAVAGADRLILTEHIAVQDCLSLARFLLLPQDDLTLAEVLRSPFVEVSEEGLFDLAYARGEKTLWQRLKENDAHKDAYDFLSGLLAVTDYMPPYELFAHVLEVCGGRKRLARRLGSEIDDPLNEFLALAIHYSKTHIPSLQGFMHWLDNGEIQIKRDMEKGRNEVRILTVHGAKGLQAPIVFIPDTVHTPPYESGILWTQNEVSTPLWSPKKAYEDKTYRALKIKEREQSGQEYRRLLYVAMTRAEDELYICGWKGSKAIQTNCWYELVRRAAEAWTAQGNIKVLSSVQTVPVKKEKSIISAAPTVPLPAWMDTPAPDEPIPTKPLIPSHIALPAHGLSPFAADARARGILVHRLLQYLPDVKAGERAEVLARFIRRYGRTLPKQEQEQIGNEVMAIIEHSAFAPVFGKDSVAEASITGLAGVNNISIAGRIDRLAVTEDAVYIIDYKTGRKVPELESEVPQPYIKQMDAYRQLVQKIYPDKTVYCGLLWMTGPKLIVLSEALLQSLAA